MSGSDERSIFARGVVATALFETHLAHLQTLLDAWIMTDHDDNRPALLLFGHDVIEQLGRARVQAGPRLIQQKQAGLVNERAAQRHPLCLASTERRERPLSERAQTYPLRDVLVARGIHALQTREQLDVLSAAQLGVTVRRMGHPAQLCPHLDAVERGPAAGEVID